MSADHAARQTTLSKTGEVTAGEVPGADSARLRGRIHALIDELMRGVLDAFVRASPAEIVEFMRSVGHNREWDGTSWRFERMANAISGDRSAAGKSSRLDEMGLAAPRQRLQSGPEERGQELERNPARRAVARDARHRRDIASPERSAEGGRETGPSLGSLDPFDITSPGELLASAGSHPAPSELLDRIAANFDRASAAAGQAAQPAPSSSPSKESSTPDDSEPTPPTGRAPAESGPGAPSDQETASERRPRVVLREGERLLSATGSGIVIRRARR